jgi:hypothetical protein
VTTHRPIALSEWSESQNPIIRRGRDARRFWHPTIIGLAGTLILHGLALQTAILHGRSHRIPPPEVREFGFSESKKTPAESLVFINLPNRPKVDDEIDESLASARRAIAAKPIAVSATELSQFLEAKSLELGEETNSESANDSGDAAEHARLLGIYSGQMLARVERIWIRPRAPVNDNSIPASAASAADYFHCEAQILQDSMGTVQEILLPSSNGSMAWRHSLVVAIQQASPLPAPPSPTVFSHVVTLNFVGYPYVSGGSEQDTSPLHFRRPPNHRVSSSGD